MDQKNKQLGRIGVLMGGSSSERAISLKSGEAIFHSLRDQGLDVVAIDLVSEEKGELKTKLEEEGCALVFIALHGKYGEDGTVQKYLADLNIPFTGSAPDASRRAFHKTITQNILKNAGITVPAYVSVCEDAVFSFAALNQQLGTNTCVVKPAAEGSSIGIQIVADETQFKKALEEAFSYGPEVLIDAYVPGRECTVGILDGQALPVVEIEHKVNFFDYKAKYEKGVTVYHAPARIPQEIAQKVQNEALKAYTALGCRHFARVDFILAEDGTIYCLEVNTIPGFTQTSLLPKAAASAGISFNQLTRMIIEYAYAKKEKRKLTFNSVKVAGVFVGVVLIAGILIYQTQGFLTKSKYFQVKSVVVDPSLAFIQKEDLTMLRGKNIFQVDLKQLKNTLNRKYPEITELKVTRRYPNQIQLLARKRHPFAQTKILNRTVTLDEQAVILSTTDGRDKKLPIISGLGRVKQKLYLGSTLNDEQLRIALSILQAKAVNEELKTFTIEEVDVKNLSKINVYLSKKLLVILDKDEVAQKIRNLSLVLHQTHIDLADIKYIDLRFKDPIIGKK